MSQWEKLIQKLKDNPTDVSFKTIKKILERYGFTITNIKGSHFKFSKEEDYIIIPTHNNKVKKYYIKQVIKSLNL